MPAAQLENGFEKLRADAGDFEDGPIGTFVWSDENGQLLGTTLGTQPLLYAPPSAGMHSVTVKVFDSGGKEGTDSVSFSVAPAPPNLKILSPKAGQQVPLGLPVDLVGVMTNFTRFGASPPYGSSVWVGYHENSIVFDQVFGAFAQGTYNQVGDSRVTWSMTVDGVFGQASQSFDVFSDGKLYVKITSPLKDNQLLDGELAVSFEDGTASTLSAVSTRDVTGGVSYTWNVTQQDANGVATVIATLSGQSVTFAPTGFPCSGSGVEVEVGAIDDLGNMASDKVPGSVFRHCEPK